jgi:hypothetical protein
LEVELLEDRHLLSPVFFVPMNPIAPGVGGSDITSAVGDFNGDGHLDVISTSSQTIFEKVNGAMEMVTQHEVVWYQNDGNTAPSFTSHTIAIADSQIPWVGVGDVDGNGTLDAVMEIGNQIWWYGNNGDGTVWTPHLVNGAQGDLSVWIADVNGDGHNDLILPYGNTITWWENVDGTGTTWQAHSITDQVRLPSPVTSIPPPIDPVPVGGGGSSTTPSSILVDTNGESNQKTSDNYTVSSVVDGQSVCTCALIAATGVPFKNQAVSDSSLAVSLVWGAINILSVGDVNGDGKLDVISSGDGSIQWWENPGTLGGAWTRHIVHAGTPFGDVRMAFAQDMNGDGKLDIVSSGFGDVSWWENSSGDGSTWVRHSITNNDWNSQSITVGDINGDGHPDLFSFAPMSSVVTWYENDGAINPSFTPHTISFPTGPGTVSLGDLNGDGRLDAVITPVFSNSITWFMNWDGQSPLPTSTPSTPELPPGSVPLVMITPASADFVPPVVGTATSASTILAGSGLTTSNTGQSMAYHSADGAIATSQRDLAKVGSFSSEILFRTGFRTGLLPGSVDVSDLSSLWDIMPPL